MVGKLKFIGMLVGFAFLTGTAACQSGGSGPAGLDTADQLAGQSNEPAPGSQPSGSSGGDDGSGSSGGDEHYYDDYYCAGAPGYGSFDNVYVRYGDHCELSGKKVYGNVYVEAAGSLRMHDTYVEGNVQSYEAKYLEISRCDIGGDVQIKKTYGDPTSIHGNDIYGNLQVEENYNAFDIARNYVYGDLQFFKNDGKGSPHTIYKNKIEQNLQCKENYPYPIRGGENTVYGNAEDQCYKLAY